MSRMGAEGHSSAGSTQLSAKVPEPLKEEFREACEQRGESMTDVIEAKMREVVGAETDDVKGAIDDDRLRSAYQALRDEADPDDRKIDTDPAESAVAESCRVNSRSVRTAVLDPLQRRNAIQYRWGQIRVNPPEEIDDD